MGGETSVTQTCPHCGASGPHPGYATFGQTLVQCRSCGEKWTIRLRDD